MTTDEARLAVRAAPARAPRFTVGWMDAIFEHYRVVDPSAVGLPPELELDLFDGAPWISVVSFRMVDMRWRGIPLYGARTYPQVNARTYVVGPDGVPGVFFLRNLVSNRLAAAVGRWMYGMPYVWRRVALEAGRCEAGAHRVAGVLGARRTGHEQSPGALEFFLCERYPLYARRGGRTEVAAMVHPPWPLYALERVEQSHGLIEELGLSEAVVPHPEVHGSPGVDVRMWGGVVVAPRRVART